MTSAALSTSSRRSSTSDESVRKTLLHPVWHGRQKAFLLPKIVLSFVLTIFLLMIMCNFFGATYRESERTQALKILAVDYDGGVLGSAFSNAYSRLQANSFPTVEFRSAADFPDEASISKAVCHGHYWAGAFVPAGASSRLSAALGGDASEPYDSSGAFTYIYNQARYPNVADGTLLGNINAWVQVSRAAYYATANASAALAALNRTDASAVAAYLDPVSSTADLIKPMVQGPRIIYNTAYLVTPMLAPFFLTMVMNGISQQAQLFTHARIREVYAMRLCIAKSFTFMMSLALAGLVWAFRESWDASGGQFMLTWMTMWLFTEVNWVVMESIVASYLPMPAVPFFVIGWVMINVTSNVLPFELSPGWYRWGYALPAHETYQILIYVWSGCANPLRVALPVLLVWWAVGHVVTFLSVRKRCLDAEKALKASSEKA